MSEIKSFRNISRIIIITITITITFIIITIRTLVTITIITIIVTILATMMTGCPCLQLRNIQIQSVYTIISRLNMYKLRQHCIELSGEYFDIIVRYQFCFLQPQAVIVDV